MMGGKRVKSLEKLESQGEELNAQEVAVDVVCGIGGYVATVTCPAASDSAESAPAGEAGAAGEAEPANE